jgi:hypothetical protein
MKKLLVLYRSPVSAVDQTAAATPKQAQAGMEALEFLPLPGS